MFNKAARIISDHFYIQCPHSFEKEIKDNIRFGIETTLNESFKLFFYIIFFNIFNSLKSFLWTLLIFGFLRTASGGYHFKSFRACFLGSWLYFVFILTLSDHLNDFITHNPLMFFIVITINILIGSFLTPCPSKQYNIHPERYKTKKTFYVTFSIVLFGMSHLLFLNSLYLFSLIFFNIQLFLGRIRNGF